MSDSFGIREVTPGDAPIVARHRASMFHDMGTLPPEQFDRLVDLARPRLEAAIASGEYRGWLAGRADHPAEVIAGAGLQLRQTFPHPLSLTGHGTSVAEGRQALVINVYTEPSWRRRGVAEVLMKELLRWSAQHQVETVVLHASRDGRALYERLGFVPTNEMRLVR